MKIYGLGLHTKPHVKPNKQISRFCLGRNIDVLLSDKNTFEPNLIQLIKNNNNNSAL